MNNCHVYMQSYKVSAMLYYNNGKVVYTPISKIVVAAEATVNTPRLQRILVIFLLIHSFREYFGCMRL